MRLPPQMGRDSQMFPHKHPRGQASARIARLGRLIRLPRKMRLPPQMGRDSQMFPHKNL
jgi:hypothetical protein